MGTSGNTANRATHVEAVDAGKHDVDEDDVGWLLAELQQGIFAVVGLGNFPALVLKRHTNCGSDALVIFNGENSSPHCTTSFESTIAHKTRNEYLRELLLSAH